MSSALSARRCATLCLATLASACGSPDRSSADPRDGQQVAAGKAIYDQYCARCHGGNLEGQPNWKTRQANGRLPAPPHDATGHTWHHSDAALFGITRNGMTPYAGANYQSDMPAFAATLSNEQIWQVLAYIKSRWPRRIQDAQSAINRESR